MKRELAHGSEVLDHLNKEAGSRQADLAGSRDVL